LIFSLAPNGGGDYRNQQHVVTERLLKRIRTAVPRDLKNNLALGTTVKFTPEEVCMTAENMRAYIGDLITKVRALLLERKGL
jgi:hypothetical protein